MPRAPLFRCLSILKTSLLSALPLLAAVSSNSPPQHPLYRSSHSCPNCPGYTTTVVHGATAVTSMAPPIMTLDSYGDSNSDVKEVFTTYFKSDPTTFVLPDTSNSWKIDYHLSSFVGEDGVSFVYHTPYLHHVDVNVVPTTPITSTITETEYHRATRTLQVILGPPSPTHTAVSQYEASFARLNHHLTIRHLL